MFAYSKFNQDISGWDVSNVKYAVHMFGDSMGTCPKFSCRSFQGFPEKDDSFCCPFNFNQSGMSRNTGNAKCTKMPEKYKPKFTNLNNKR